MEPEGVMKIWCMRHWQEKVRPKIENGTTLGIAVTFEIVQAALNTPAFTEFSKGYANAQEAGDAFLKAFAPVCCLIGEAELDELILKCHPDEVRKWHPQAEELIQMEEGAKARGRANRN